MLRILTELPLKSKSQLAKVTEKSSAVAVYMTFHFAESPVNVLTNSVFDPVSKTPELKICAIRIEKVG